MNIKLENLSLQDFREPFELLFDTLLEESQDGNLPDVIYCVDTMGRPLSAAVKPILEAISPYIEGRPDINFVASSRVFDTKIGDVFSTEEAIEHGVSTEYYEQFVSSPPYGLDERSLYINLLVFALQVENISTDSLIKKVFEQKNSNITKIKKKYLHPPRQTKSEKEGCHDDIFLKLKQESINRENILACLLLKFLPSFFANIEKMSQKITERHKDGDKIMILDDYTYVGQTAMVFAVLSRLFPNISFEYFSMMTNEDGFISKTNGVSAKGIFSRLDNFSFLSGTTVSAYYDSPYSRLLWDEQAVKQAMSGVIKNPGSSVVEKSDSRNHKLMSIIRNKFKQIGEEVVKTKTSPGV